MAAQVQAARLPPPSFTEEELGRMLQFDKIVKLSDIITSGKHPRIKVPPHLVPSSTRSASPKASLPTEAQPNASGAAHATTAGSRPQLTKSTGVHGANSDGNPKAHGENSLQSAQASSVASLPGLGLARQETSCAPHLAAGSVAHGAETEFSLQRARIEALLREEVDHMFESKRDGAPYDLALDDVLQRARQLEQTFTPPPGAMLSDVTTNLDGAAAKLGTKAASGTVGDSGSDQTFYSSNFSTPEFGLASRIPADSDNVDVSMEDSSDYEPELDPVVSSQPAQQPARMWNDSISRLSGHTDPSRPNDPFRGPGSMDRYNESSGGSADRRNVVYSGRGPPSPFVRTHNLSPVAPQPEHISSLAAVTRLPAAGHEAQPVFYGASSQVALLRREEASQSSPDSSSQTGARTAEKKKGKKNSGKRKANAASTSPRVKAEPKSPSPISAPPVQRPHKRLRQGAQAATGGVPRPYDYDNEYNPTIHYHTNSHASSATARPRRVGRGHTGFESADVAERYMRPAYVTVGHPVSQPHPPNQGGYERYEAIPERYVQHPAESGWRPSGGQPVPHYALPASQPGTRLVRAASHAIDSPIQHAIPPARSGYQDGPEALSIDIGHARAPVVVRMASMPHRASPPRARIVMDEFNREYFEPAQPEPRQQMTVDPVPYDPHVAYERSASRIQHGAPTAQRYARVESQLPMAYGSEEVIYRQTSPAFATQRRVVTQPDYAPREYVGHPPREPSARPLPYAYGPAPPQAVAPGPEGAPVREYFVRAATARPPESVRYELPPPARFVERVGSARPPDMSVAAGHGFAAALNAPRVYDGRVLGGPPPPHGPESVYIDSHLGHEVFREYNMRPEPQVVVQRAYSAHPGPPPPPFYAEERPGTRGPPGPGYVYPDGSAPHDVYR